MVLSVRLRSSAAEGCAAFPRKSLVLACPPMLPNTGNKVSVRVSLKNTIHSNRSLPHDSVDVLPSEMVAKKMTSLPGKAKGVNGCQITCVGWQQEKIYLPYIPIPLRNFLAYPVSHPFDRSMMPASPQYW